MVGSLQQSKALAKKLLSTGMEARAEAEIDEVVRKLASRDIFFSHGAAISHREAAALGLRSSTFHLIANYGSGSGCCTAMYDHDCRKARYLKVLEGRSKSTAVAAASANT
jgi:hypothetical protein